MNKIKGLRWWIIGLIALITIINYIDRNALPIMWSAISTEIVIAPEIEKQTSTLSQEEKKVLLKKIEKEKKLNPDHLKEFSIPAEDKSFLIQTVNSLKDTAKSRYALISILFMIAYAISQMVSGKIYDKITTRMGFLFSILIWSMSSGLQGLAGGLVVFGILRATLGFGEAGNWPGAAKSNAEWHPIKERAFAQGIFNAGASVGAIISAPLIALLYVELGWRWTFPVIATFSLLWLIPWFIINKGTPAKHPKITEEEKNYILSGQPTSGNDRVLKWGELLKMKQSYAVIVTRFFLDPIWWMFVSWLPIYLNDTFKFDVKQIGYFAWVPYVGAAIGSLSGGYASGYLIKKGWSVDKARKTIIVIGNIICLPALILTAFASTPIAAVLLISVILFGFQISINNIQTLPSDYLSGKSVGSLAGLGGMAAASGVVVSMLFIPELTKISWTPFFFMGAILIPLGVLSVFLFSGKIERIKVN